MPRYALTEADRLLTRTLIAVQAELQLDRVSIPGFKKLLLQVPGDGSGTILPKEEQEVEASLTRLEGMGYVALERANPHLTVTFPGLMSCGMLEIPEVLIAPLSENAAQENLA